MKRLNFFYNWNGKLGCLVFSTIRRKNDYWQDGATYDVYLQYEFKFKAQLMAIIPIIGEDLNQIMCWHDTGYTVGETKTIFCKMLKLTPEQLEKENLQILYFKKIQPKKG